MVKTRKTIFFKNIFVPIFPFIWKLYFSDETLNINYIVLKMFLKA